MSSLVTGGLSRSARVGPEGPEFWIQPCGYTVDGGIPPFADQDIARAYKIDLQQDKIYLDQWLENFVSSKYFTFVFLTLNIHICI